MSILSTLSLVFAMLIDSPMVLNGPQLPEVQQPMPSAPQAPVPALGSVQPTRPVSLAGRYRLRQGDSFDLIFPFVSSFNRTVTVQPDGYIALPIVGELHVAGQAVPELEAALRARYANILRDPVITIALRDFEKPYFVATGEVERPGKYELRGETTVAQALAIAGGLKDKAKRSRILLFRAADEGVLVQELDLKQALSHGRRDEDVKVNPGDMIFVQKSRAPSASSFLPVLSVLPWLFRPF